MPPQTAPTPIIPDSPHREALPSFVRWALAQLQLPIDEDEADLILTLPETDRTAFAGQQRLRLPKNGPGAAGQESLAWDDRFGRWLADRLRLSAPALHARPRQQPMTVGDVASKLFAAYTVDRGQVHLAGCQLTDHPFMRLSFAGTDDDPTVRHVFVAPDGSSIADHLVSDLGLDDLEPVTKPIPKLEPAAIRSLESAGRRIAAKQSTERDPTAATVDPLAIAILWVRHVEGRLQFTIGKATATLPFSSWARLLTPPPLPARHSGASTYHVAATSDGRIDATEQIAVCEQSGHRVLKQELVQCSVTGKRVLTEFTETCPVSGKPALRSEFHQCDRCRQRVSKSVLTAGVCTACQNLTAISPDDPRLVWIFNEHPGLDRWKRWRLAETQTVYIAEAAGLLQRLLIVVDKETLAPHRIATASRLSPTWIDASEAERAELLT